MESSHLTLPKYNGLPYSNFQETSIEIPKIKKLQLLYKKNLNILKTEIYNLVPLNIILKELMQIFFFIAKDCLQRMMKVNPAYRITSSELFEHPWFLVSCLKEKKILAY